jgi:hypothetical protein
MDIPQFYCTQLYTVSNFSNNMFFAINYLEKKIIQGTSLCFQENTVFLLEQL